MPTPEKSETDRRQSIGSFEAILSRVDRLLEVARPEAVYAPPVTVGTRTVIGAAEVLIATGVGGGGGYDARSPEGEEPAAADAMDNGGFGGGGGGYAQSRPVAVVIIDDEGVRVEPVVDATKLGLAALTVFGSMVFFLGRIMRRTREFDRDS